MISVGVLCLAYSTHVEGYAASVHDGVRCKLLIAVALGVELAHNISQEIAQRQVGSRNISNIKIEACISDFVRIRRDIQQLVLTYTLYFLCNMLRLLTNIAALQERNRRTRLLAVRLCLQAVQLCTFINVGLQLLGSHSSLQLLHFCCSSLLLCLLLARLRQQRYDNLMRIVQQIVFDKAFKISALDTLAQMGNILIIAQAVNRIAAVEPIVHHA